jgi:hypothetical protein
MSNDRPKHETMSIEEATVSNMWEIAASAESPHGYPSAVLLSGLLPPRPRVLCFSQSGQSQAEWQGGVIMTRLRALVGAGFLLAVIGTVVAVPLGWSLLLGIIEAYPEKINQVRLYQPKAELGQKKSLPRTTYEQIRDKIEAKQK